MNRFFQVLLIASTAGLSWLGMMAVHELGHVLAAWTSGGVVERIDLHPLVLSHTMLAANPCPLYVAWGGPILGCLFPLALLGIVKLFAKPYDYLAAFFAGFCLVANGAYLGGGTFSGGNALDGNTLDDGAVILNSGGEVWQLLLFALLTVPSGLWLLNGLGKHFGLVKGASRGKVDHKAAVVVAVVFSAVVCSELVVF